EEGQFSIVDPYLSLFMESGNGLNVHVGTRLNTHSEYDTEILYNLNPSYVFGVGGNRMIKLLGSISTSNITPSLFQLYSPFFGSTDLVPEQSVNYEFGASFYDKGSLEVNLAYFIRDESNPIGFVSQFDDMGNFIGGAYENVSNDRNVNGWEFDAAWTIGQVRLTSYYTYVDSDQPASLRRIPNHKFGLGATGRFGDLSASLKYNRTGSRPEFDPMTFEQIELEAFGLLDIHMAQCLMDQKLELYGGLNNVLDTDFVGIPGFTTRGRTIEVGVKWMW
ncbi:MAG: TonB-dependent receptor, partial [Bacteroidota bacterium]